jgi:GNAT superfamily N-acetyltransferase
MNYQISKYDSLHWQEVADLFISVGWGDRYEEADILRSLQAYPIVLQARDAQGVLIGYASAFSDGSFSTMLGELVVHPSAQRKGIGQALLSAFEKEFPNVPVTIKALGESKHFFKACGYQIPRAEVTAMFKRID